VTPSLRAEGIDNRALDPEREPIYEALATLVAKGGLPALEVESVLDAAGIDRAIFDQHFRGVQDCFDQLWEQLTAEYTSGWNAAFGGDAPWRDRLRAAAYYTLRYFSEDPTRTTFFMVGAQSGGELAQARRDRMIARAIEMVDEARTALAHPDSIPRNEAEAVVGAIYEAILGAASEGDLERLAERVPQLMYIAVLPYRGIEAAEAELRRGPADLARYQSRDL
jgi:AcrR family transcriptional regulator